MEGERCCKGWQGDCISKGSVGFLTFPLQSYPQPCGKHLISFARGPLYHTLILRIILGIQTVRECQRPRSLALQPISGCR